MARLPFQHLSRRQALLAGTALPFAASAFPSSAIAEADMMGHSFTRHHRFPLGAFEVTALLAGTQTRPDPHSIFGLNVSEEEFARVAEAHFIPTDRAQFFFTPVVVNTGTELVLFDTGTDAEGITTALQDAGHAPDQIDVVVLTHMHGDHIGGLMRDGVRTFANARYVTGRVEHEHWAAAGNEGFNANVRPLGDDIRLIEGEDEVAPGITAIEAFGHTPGHLAFMLESEGARLALIADTANHFAWSVEHPDWEVRFDMDKMAAAETRRRIFGMLAQERIPFIGYHMPFPALGYVAAEGEGFRYVPASYQMMLDGA
ncbi:MBL fold metallo-hydrolase [Plastorhodobacter daqingensis]|uniref:MBL fold metallo-hydrolase n=1 Tax=Plastorhodobacter daqingensis TaxID=1387281 RepID=A0ABW2UNH0_9RHOB